MIKTRIVLRILLSAGVLAVLVLACAGMAAGVTWTVDDDGGANFTSIQADTASTPAIEFTYVPPYGSFDDLEGQVWNVTPAEYRVAIYIYVSGWWTKPTFAEPVTTIQDDGSWICDITTGGSDQYATRIKAYLIPDGYTPPQMDGGHTLPEELDQNSAASVDVIRREERHITFSGYNWTVKSSEILVGPGPNYFSDSNQSVWIDEEGQLHLKILKKDGKWYCSEVYTAESMGYGKYIFYAASRVDRLDRNVVAGLFTWDDEAPEYNYREIDIEFSRWGNEVNDNAQYTVQPWDHPENMHRFNITLNGNHSTHSFDWSIERISFQSLHGHHQSPPDDPCIIESWSYTGDDIPPAGGENARINLWLSDAGGDGIGDSPSDGQEAEIIIRRFEHISDTTPPIINTVALNTTTPNPCEEILITVNATDNIAVTSVTASGIPLTHQTGDIWTGTITAISGTHFVNVSVSDAAGNIAWNNSTSYTATTLPPSLDQYYKTEPPVYLIEMFELGESMMGISVNIQQGDMGNAANSFTAFSEKYSDNAEMVPEWQNYYDLDAVEEMGTALESWNIPGVFGAMGKVGRTCSDCHLDTMPAVWNEYNWKDFRTVIIDTPEGPLPFDAGKMMHLSAGFDGIGVNIREGDLSGAQQSFSLFETMFENMTEACYSCHLTEPRYYVSEDVQTMIDDMGTNITSGNLSVAEDIRHEIGMSCYRCHVSHIPAQYAKECHELDVTAIPPSLDQYYKTQPPVYLIEMFELGESMMGISVNIQQGDMGNAANSFTAFSEKYNDSAEMVPEWHDYYDLDAVEEMGTALEAGNIPGVFGAIGAVGRTCSDCHLDTMPAVWNRYNWKDFRTVSIDTPEGALQFDAGKMMHLSAGFDGIGVNIREGDLSGAQQSFSLFETMFENMTEACYSCHLTEPRYYVSEDVQTMIDDMGERIDAGDPVNMSAAEEIRHDIGMSCYRCHVLHIPAQYAKEAGDTKPPHPLLKDDAYHYSPDGINDHLYTEWWYFNVYNDDRQFMVSYFLADPGNLTGIGDAKVLAVVYNDTPLIGFTSTPTFTADYEKPDVTIGSNRLLALNDTAFVISGSCYDFYTLTPIQWNLTYTMDVGSWFGAPAPIHVGHIPGDWMQWLCYMTGADVAGTITIGETTYNMSGRGYHDHNWGEWLFDDPQWNWAQVSAPEENVSLIIGDVIAPPARSTMMAFKYDGRTMTFDDIDLTYAAYEFDPITSKLYPDGYHITGNSDEYSLDVMISVARNVPIVRPFPGALPDYVLFEQVSDYNITLFEDYEPVYRLNQSGFSEYTTHNVHTVYGRVLNGGGALVTVTNARTLVSKQSVVASGYYSVDGDFLDYLANDTSPWVADGDVLIIEAVKDQNRGNTTVIVDISMDKQQATDITLQPMPRKCDLNCDGFIDTADAAIALQIAAGGSASCDPATLAAADVSGDNRVTSLDALMILQAAGGRIEL